MTGVELPPGIDLEASSTALCEAGRWIGASGWCPATSGNFSSKLGAAHVLVTRSGADKSALVPGDLLIVDSQGTLVWPIRSDLHPSAETLLHVAIYGTTDATCILHTHSRAATVLSRVQESEGALRLTDFEVLKGLDGVDTHRHEEVLAILPNSQRMPELADHVRSHLTANPKAHGFLIAGHGLYTWGRTADNARQHVAALEFLLDCELHRRLLVAAQG